MPTHQKFDLVVKTGEYEKDGQKKGRYQRIGKVMESEKGMYVLLDKLFVSPQLLMVMPPDQGNDSLVAWMNEPYGKKDSAPAGHGNTESDIPF